MTIRESIKHLMHKGSKGAYMHVESFTQQLQHYLDKFADKHIRLKAIADGVASFFSLRNHEIGLFAIDHKKEEVSFLLPEGMAKKGSIPLTAMDSLVVRTAKEQVPYLDNHFTRSRHLFMFEQMLTEKSSRLAVQKIMSAPIISGGIARGVIQVAKKGDSLTEAGSDFTQENLSALVRIADLLSGYDIFNSDAL